MWGFGASLGISLSLLATGFLASGAIVNPEHDKTFFILLKNILAWQVIPFFLSFMGTTLSWFIKKGFDIKILKKRHSFPEDQIWTLWDIPFFPADIVWSLIGMIVTGFLIACLGGLFYFAHSEYFNRIRQDRLAKASISIAKRLSFPLPQKIDDTASLQKVSASGATLTFYYVLNRKVPAQEAQELLETRRRKLKDAYCKNTSMDKVLRMGGAFRFNFSDARGSEIGSFILSKEECAA